MRAGEMSEPADWPEALWARLADVQTVETATKAQSD
jgi:hypothetical protein